MVYVISKEGTPLMPTERHSMVRRLLKTKEAKVIKRHPFTIQLLKDSKNYTQETTLGLDSGYGEVGFSVVTATKELISGEATLLTGQKERLEEKRQYRRIRRSRKRYRAKRFDNRRRDKGWLDPSIQHKLDSHLRIIENLKKILPISKIVVEVANFDIQKIKNPEIQGTDYQNGEQKGFWNLREYILHRDHHTCQLCKATDNPLQVHHIGFYRKDRTDRPGNLITLCTKCHVPQNHKKGAVLWGWEPTIKPFKAATFMSTVRWKIANILEATPTYGHITKSHRIALELPKTHYHDAFCIAGGLTQTRIQPILIKQVRRNNRSLEKFYDAKYIDARTGNKVSGQELNSGRRRRNKNTNSENLHPYRQQKVSKGRRSIRTTRYFYQPNDLVKLDGKVLTVKGIQNKGAYIKLRELSKPVKTSLVTPYAFQKGLCFLNYDQSLTMTKHGDSSPA